MFVVIGNSAKDKKNSVQIHLTKIKQADIKEYKILFS